MSQLKVIQLSGILDSVSGGQLRRTIEDAISNGEKIVLLDCTAIEFMDSSGLGALVMGLKQIRALGGRLALVGINDQVQMLLELTDMAEAFEIFPNREAFEQIV
ncbi:MAG: STAS domain-containing protein [Elainella sp.]